ncbi:MAG TPA: hypothetical protein VMX94_00100 [Armatimonadota bacterium]|nr:hypothetical protein [Armatimonadota bacterium]
MSIPALCSIVVCAGASICIAFVILAGIVVSRVEEEFWGEFWAQTPITEGASVRLKTAEASGDQLLKKAA